MKKKIIIALVGLFLIGFIYFLKKQNVIDPTREIKPYTNSFVQKVQADINSISTSCTDFEKIKNDIKSFANSRDLGTDSTENSYWRNALLKELTIQFAKRIVADSKWIFSSNSCPGDRIEILDACIVTLNIDSLASYGKEYADTLSKITTAINLRKEIINCNSKCQSSLISDQQISYENYPSQEAQKLIKQVENLEKRRRENEYLGLCEDLGNSNNQSLRLIINNHKKHIEDQIQKLLSDNKRNPLTPLNRKGLKAQIEANINSLNSYETPEIYKGDIPTLVEELNDKLGNALQIIYNRQ